MPIGIAAGGLQAGGLIETVSWSSDFSEYAGIGVAFLPETGWEANDWDDGGHDGDSFWRTTNNSGVSYLQCSSASSHLHYDGLIENHEVEVDCTIMPTISLGGVVLAVDSSNPLQYIGVELVRIEATSDIKACGYVRWEIGGVLTEDFFYLDEAFELNVGQTYNVRARFLDNFVTIWIDDVVVSGYQLTEAQIPDVEGHTRCGLIHFNVSGAMRFDNLTLRGLQNSGAPQLPLAPIYLEGTPGPESVELTWQPLSANITDYVIQYALASAPTSWSTFSEGTSDEATTIVTGLTAEVPYIFRVAAVTSVGQGPYSEDSDEVTPIESGGALPTGMLLHFDASAIVGLSNGDPISTWADQSGNGLDATRSGSNRPTYIASGLNSLPTVRFDGTDDYFNLPSGFTTWTAGFAWFFVTTPAASAKSFEPLLMFGNGTSTTHQIYREGDDQGGAHAFTSGGGVRFGSSSASLFADGVGMVLSFHNPAGAAEAAVTGQFRKGNVDWGSVDMYVPWVTTRSNSLIGVSVYGSEFYTGDISEIVVYNRVLDETEISQAYAFLNDKYGL